MPSIDMHVGGKIAARRYATGLSVESLAERTGITPERLRTYEAGEQRPTAAEMVTLYEALGVLPSYFFEDFSPTDEPPPARCDSRRVNY